MKERKPRTPRTQDPTEKARLAAAAEIERRLDGAAEANGKAPDAEIFPAGKGARSMAAKARQAAAARRGKADDVKTPPAKEAAMGATPAKAPKAKDAKPTPTREAKAKRPSGIDLAAKVLASSKEPLNAKTIAERVLAAGWATTGRTPHATLYAAMIREIAAKGNGARFRKTDRGLFAFNGKGA